MCGVLKIDEDRGGEHRYTYLTYHVPVYRCMSLKMTKSGATHLISVWMVQVYVFKNDKVRGHAFYISEEGTGVFL